MHCLKLWTCTLYTHTYIYEHVIFVYCKCKSFEVQQPTNEAMRVCERVFACVCLCVCVRAITLKPMLLTQWKETIEKKHCAFLPEINAWEDKLKSLRVSCCKKKNYTISLPRSQPRKERMATMHMIFTTSALPHSVSITSAPTIKSSPVRNTHNLYYTDCKLSALLGFRV